MITRDSRESLILPYIQAVLYWRISILSFRLNGFDPVKAPPYFFSAVPCIWKIIHLSCFSPDIPIKILLLFGECNLYHIIWLAVQYLTQFMQCFHCYIFIMPDIAHCVAADIIMIYQTVSCNTALFHSTPKWIIISIFNEYIIYVSFILYLLIEDIWTNNIDMFHTKKNLP